MAQHDYVIANGTGAAVRSDINNGLAAIVSNNSGTSEPATMYAYQWWADTTTGLLKIRNAANNAWVTVGTLADASLGLLPSAGTLIAALGSASTPSVTFTGDLNTGIFSPGADQVAISTGGTERLFIDASGNVEIKAQGDLRFADSDSSNWVAFQAPATVASDVTWTLPAADGTSAQVLSTDGSGTLSWASVASDKISEGNTEAEVVDTGSDGHFKVTTEGSERLRVDPSGRLLVGTSTAYVGYGGSNSNKLQIAGSSYTDGSVSAFVFGSTNAGGSLNLGLSRNTTVGSHTVVQSGDNLGGVTFNGSDGSAFKAAAEIFAYCDGTPGTNDMPGRLVFSTTADGASSPTERMRIKNNGRITVGDSGVHGTAYSFKLVAGTDGNAGRYFGIGDALNEGLNALSRDSGTSSYTHIQFNNGNGSVGSITTNGSATAYNVSSDYRLKENIVPLTGAADRVNQIPVHRFNFIADPDQTVDGFLAHEAQAVVPECVVGTKDEVDADGNPVYQGIDQSKLVPLLTAALQEALQKIEDLEGRLTAAGL